MTVELRRRQPVQWERTPEAFTAEVARAGLRDEGRRMGTYGETMRHATQSPHAGAIQPPGPGSTVDCDQCVAPAVAAVTFGEGESALSLEFCQHHLTEHTATLAAGGHQIRLHD